LPAALPVVRTAVPADAGPVTGVGRKHGRWIDTVLMQKDLGPGR